MPFHMTKFIAQIKAPQEHETVCQTHANFCNFAIHVQKLPDAHRSQHEARLRIDYNLFK
jgi:hypothetical protein